MAAPWKKHRFLAGPNHEEFDHPPADTQRYRDKIEPWLSAVLQAEHLALLVGSGLGLSIAQSDGGDALSMASASFGCTFEDKMNLRAAETAKLGGRDRPNLEDQMRAALALQEGLAIAALPEASSWEAAIGKTLKGFVANVLASERSIAKGFLKEDSVGRANLQGLLLSFASRPATRDRLHLFTTNYDRLLEHGCDLLGLRIVDRFVGMIEPEFRASRLEVDFHYNPPGIRGEPRYLEGVIRFSKLHGSIDWSLGTGGAIRRRPLPFAASENHSEVPPDPFKHCMVFPNAAKDYETAFYPYAELFRDFAGATCRPNSTLVTYGYGFGDDHVNRVILDMLSLPSTHLVIISWDGAGGRIPKFVERVPRPASQLSLLLGPHFGDLTTLVRHYLPSPALDVVRTRAAELLQRRGDPVRPTPRPEGSKESEE